MNTIDELLCWLKCEAEKHGAEGSLNRAMRANRYARGIECMQLELNSSEAVDRERRTILLADGQFMAGTVEDAMRIRRTAAARLAHLEQLLRAMEFLRFAVDSGGNDNRLRSAWAMVRHKLDTLPERPDLERGRTTKDEKETE